MAAPATLGDSFRSFFDAVEQFFEGLADVRLGSLLLGLVAFAVYLTFRARAPKRRRASSGNADGTTTFDARRNARWFAGWCS